MAEENEKKPAVIEEKDYEWRDDQERMLKKWADKALCFKMMHERANKRYWCLNAWFNIPVIVISTITGTGNFASGSFGEGTNQTFIFALGALNIFAGILATIASYTSVAQKLEAHRFSTISWDKYARKLQIELSKSRKDRAKAKDYIKQAAEDYDRLIEMSPILPNDIIRWFTTMIETGQFVEDLNEVETCCFECCCFPCGCNYCKCFSCKCCFEKKITAKNQELMDIWKKIELPEVIGRVKPTEIAHEPEPDTPPPLVIVEMKHKELTREMKEVNEYDIYKLNSMEDNV
jgi:hypothetical protein